jgi:hypothetical protein
LYSGNLLQQRNDGRLPNVSERLDTWKSNKDLDPYLELRTRRLKCNILNQQWHSFRRATPTQCPNHFAANLQILSKKGIGLVEEFSL